MIDTTNAHKITVNGDKSDYWDWCCDNAADWLMKMPIMGSTVTYYFKNSEDILAFKLKFNL